MTTPATSPAPPAGTALPPRPTMSYRWLLVLLALALVVSILLVYAQNQVYQPATPFLGGSGDHIHAFALDPLHANHLYVGTHYGFFRSTNGGQSWARLNGQGGAPDTLVATSVSISPVAGATVYATGYLLSTGNAGGVYVTADDAAHWRLLPTGGAGNLPDPRILFVAAGWSGVGESYAYSIDYGLFQTLDAGAHWRQVAAPFAGQVTAFMPYLDCGGVATATTCPERILVGTTQGLYRGDVTPTGPLTFVPLPAVDGYIYAVAVHRAATPSFVVSAAQGLYHATGGTTAFQPLSSVANGATVFTSLAVSGANPNLVYGVTRDNVVQQSTDGGQHWTSVATGMLTRNVSQLQAGLRAATGSNTPQWAGGQNIFSTLLQAPVGPTTQVFVGISFPVQLFAGTGTTWKDLGQG